MIQPKKTLSQNFLLDQKTIDQMVLLLDLQLDDQVIEIGPGKGAITDSLISKKISLTAIEKDLDCFHYLQKRFEKSSHIDLTLADILSVDPGEIIPNRAKVISNLPFHITTKILEWILLHSDLFSSATLILQYEMAIRALSLANAKRYSAINVFINNLSNFQLIRKIPKSFFSPRPHVDAALIHMSFEKKLKLNKRHYLTFLKEIFHQRRKKFLPILQRNFSGVDMAKIFQLLNIDQSIRPQNLSPKQYLLLYRTLFPKKKSLTE